MKITASIGILISLFTYVLIGSIVYILYGAILTDSMLDSMKIDSASPLIILENIAYVINVIMCFPITFAVFKNYLIYSISMLATSIKNSRDKNMRITPVNEQKHPDLTSNKDFELKNIDDIKTQNENLPTEKEETNKEHGKEDGSHDDHSHGHDMVEISYTAQTFIVFLVVTAIVLIANLYSNMKIVSQNNKGLQFYWSNLFKHKCVYPTCLILSKICS